MEAFVGKTGSKVHFLSFSEGDLLLESIREYIAKESIKNACVVSGMGTLSDCVMHMVKTTGYPVEESFEHWNDKPLEISSISGLIADGAEHLHMVVSNHRVAYSGHVEPGCRVLYVCEVVIQEIEDINIGRRRNEHGANVLCKL